MNYITVLFINYNTPQLYLKLFSARDKQQTKCIVAGPQQQTGNSFFSAPTRLDYCLPQNIILTYLIYCFLICPNLQKAIPTLPQHLTYTLSTPPCQLSKSVPLPPKSLTSYYILLLLEL